MVLLEDHSAFDKNDYAPFPDNRLEAKDWTVLMDTISTLPLNCMRTAVRIGDFSVTGAALSSLVQAAVAPSDTVRNTDSDCVLLLVAAGIILD